MSLDVAHVSSSVNLASLLIIDDDPTVRLAAEELLVAEGFKVKCIATASALPELLTRYHPDAVLVDLNLPDSDGYQVCNYIRRVADMSLVPIMMMTADDQAESVSRAYEAGATDFIAKPLHYSLLAYRVKYMLRNFLTLRYFRQQKNSLQQAQHLAKLGYWSLDIEDGALEIEPYSAALLGWDEDRRKQGLTPSNYGDLLRFVDRHDLEALSGSFDALLKDHQPFSIEHRISLSSGEDRIVHHLGSIFQPDGSRYVRAMGIIQDLTERRKAEQKIYELAYYDSLTSLPNRSFLREYWNQVFYGKKLQQYPQAVVCLSLNHFSRVNDSFGQDVGDELMRRVANRLNRAFRSKAFSEHVHLFNEEIVIGSHRNRCDAVARIESNSFIFFVKHGASRELLVKLCTDLRVIVEEPFTMHGTSIFLKVKIGVAIMSDITTSLSKLLDAALSAVNFAKHQDDQVFVFFSADMMTSAREKIELERDLRASLKSKDFFLVYQPKINLTSGEIVGFEALIRWNHPEKGYIPPNEFIAVAEETGLIEELGIFVLEQTCEDLKILTEQGYDHISMAINVSARQFSQGSFTDCVADAIRAHDLRPEQLELEITESIIMNNVEHALQMLHTLKDIGVRVAIDDFGTGYSSFSYLARFPFDTLKIDQEFLKEIPSNPSSLAICKSILALCHGLGLRSVAEGIENEEQLVAMIGLQSDHGQGYLFSAPKVFAHLKELLADEKWLTKIPNLIRENAFHRTSRTG